MLKRLRDRLGDQRGFTVIEAMITVSLTLIVTTSTLLVVTRAQKGADSTQRRTEAAQQARLAEDQAIQVLRSQVCRDATQVPIFAADGSNITFFASFGDAASTVVPDKHVLALSATGALTDSVYTGTANAAGVVTYPATATNVRTLGQNLDTTTAPFAYYGYNNSSPPTASTLLNASTAPYAVTSGNLNKIGRIVVTLTGRSKGAVAGSKSIASFSDQVYVRQIDQTATPPAVDCS